MAPRGFRCVDHACVLFDPVHVGLLRAQAQGPPISLDVHLLCRLHRRLWGDSLIFPIGVDPGQATDAPSETHRSPRRLRILVVDDDPLLLKSLRETLATDGHDVAVADGGQAGIDAFVSAHQRGEPFTVVLTDLGMPYVDGRKVAAAVKAVTPSTPVVLVTGWGQRMQSENDLPAHVDCIVSKPPKMSELRRTLAELVGDGARDRPDVSRLG